MPIAKKIETKKIELKGKPAKSELDLHPKMFPEAKAIAKHLVELRAGQSVRNYLNEASADYNCELCTRKLRTPYCGHCKKPSGTSAKHSKWQRHRREKAKIKNTLKEDLNFRTHPLNTHFEAARADYGVYMIGQHDQGNWSLDLHPYEGKFKPLRIGKFASVEEAKDAAHGHHKDLQEEEN